MNCRNHPDKPATGKCASCGGDFCEECLSQFSGKDYCLPCLKTEAAFASAHIGGGREELARMKKTLVGCSVVLIALVLVPMILLVYPTLRLGDVAHCRNNMKRIYTALETYAERHDGCFPPDNNDLRPLFTEKILKDTQLFQCPGAGRVLAEMEDVKTSAAQAEAYPPWSSYLYQGGLRLPEKGKPPRPLLWDRSPGNHRRKGINILYTDGDVRFVTKHLSRIRLRPPASNQ